MEVRRATVNDIDEIVKLQESCHISNVNEAEKSDGFLNTVLDAQLLRPIIEQEGAVFVAVLDGKVVAMAVCASWHFWAFSKALSTVSNNLKSVRGYDNELTRTNSYFWGPVCVGKECRGQGVFEQLFTYSRAEMSKTYPFVYTYVHEDNARSFAAHTKKAGFNFIKDFELNGQVFKEMVRETKFA